MAYTVIHFCPKLRENLRIPLNRNFGMNFGSFFSNSKFRYLKIPRKIVDPKFRVLIPDWIREKVDSDFCSPGRTLEFWPSFLSCLGLEPRIFGFKVDAWARWTKRPTDLREKKSNLDDVRWHVIQWLTSERFRWKKTKFRIKFINFRNNETSGLLRVTRKFRGFQPKLPLNNRKFR